MTNSFQQYLNSIGREPMLTPSEEIELAKHVQQGKPLQQFSPKTLTPRQKRQIRMAQRARDRMITANLRLAVNAAKKYYPNCTSMGMDDLAQEAILGLIAGTEKFDPTRGYKFSTYIYWWLRQSISRGMKNKERMIRIPVHAEDSVYRFKRVRCQHLARGNSVSSEAIAKEANTSLEVVDRALRATVMYSLDKLVRSGKAELSDFVAAEPDDAPSLEDYGIDDVQVLSDAIDKLSPERAYVLRRYYGIGMGKATFQAIGKERGYSRERARQYHEKACRQLRSILLEMEISPR